MRVIVATAQVPFVRGGAELCVEGVRDALIAAGHQAEIAAVPFKWYPPERLLDAMLACRLLDLSESCGTAIDVVVAMKFPAYYIPHPRKVLWLLHQYRAAYDLWGNELADLHREPLGSQVKAAIEQADRRFLPEARAIFADSRRVAARLLDYCGIASRPLYHPPPNAGLYHGGAARDYFFFPSRLNRAKRQELVIQALALTECPVEVRFAGEADEPAHAEGLRELARRSGVESRVRWLGSISEEEKIELYAHAAAVLYPTYDEDYGYVTLEAMLASKPVIACADSGGPLEFVVPEETGLVARPDAAALAEAMDRLWDGRAAAARMGCAGRDRYAALDISWDHAIGQLLA